MKLGTKGHFCGSEEGSFVSKSHSNALYNCNPAPFSIYRGKTETLAGCGFWNVTRVFHSWLNKDRYLYCGHYSATHLIFQLISMQTPHIVWKQMYRVPSKSLVFSAHTLKCTIVAEREILSLKCTLNHYKTIRSHQ